MDQWRPKSSHAITPKLIYTTASKPQYGLKAFVVDNEWYVKMAGGTSQQYNYTGIVYQDGPQRLDGIPNNLTENGLNLLNRLTEMKLPYSSLIYYVASIYNSSLAIEFLEQVGGGTPFAIRVPAANQREIVSGLSVAGHCMRNLFWLLNIADRPGHLDEQVLSPFAAEFLQTLGIKRGIIKGRRFKDRTQYIVPEDLESRIREHAEDLQEKIDSLCSDLYS
jgi:hypothetical protein